MTNALVDLLTKHRNYVIARGGETFIDVLGRVDDLERWDYFSALFWLQRQGAKNYRGVPDSKKFKPNTSRENVMHNLGLLRQGGISVENMTSKEGLLKIREGLVKDTHERQPFNKTGVVPLNLFYTSKDLDKEKCYSLLEAKNYKPNENFGGFKSSWVKDCGGRISYCVYLQEENGHPLFDLKYIAKSRGENEKYDLVVRFNKQGIREIKHAEVSLKDFSLSPEIADCSFFEKTNYIPFMTYFFKDRKEKSCIECGVDDGNGNIKMVEIGRDEKSKIVLEGVLRNEPILAGGAYRRILEFCKNNYSGFLQIYKNLKNGI